MSQQNNSDLQNLIQLRNDLLVIQAVITPVAFILGKMKSISGKLWKTINYLKDFKELHTVTDELNDTIDKTISGLNTLSILLNNPFCIELSRACTSAKNTLKPLKKDMVNPIALELDRIYQIFKIDDIINDLTDLANRIDSITSRLSWFSKISLFFTIVDAGVIGYCIAKYHKYDVSTDSQNEYSNNNSSLHSEGENIKRVNFIENDSDNKSQLKHHQELNRCDRLLAEIASVVVKSNLVNLQFDSNYWDVIKNDLIDLDQLISDVNLVLSPLEFISTGANDFKIALDPIHDFVSGLEHEFKKEITIPKIDVSPLGTIKSFNISIDGITSMVKSEIDKVEKEIPLLLTAKKDITKAVQSGVDTVIKPIKSNIEKKVNEIKKKTIGKIDESKLKANIQQLEGELFSDSLPDFSKLQSIVPNIEAYTNSCKSYGKS